MWRPSVSASTYYLCCTARRKVYSRIQLLYAEWPYEPVFQFSNPFFACPCKDVFAGFQCFQGLDQEGLLSIGFYAEIVEIHV